MTCSPLKMGPNTLGMYEGKIATSSGYGFDVDDCANKFVGDHPGFTGGRAAGLNDMNDMLASLPQDKE